MAGIGGCGDTSARQGFRELKGQGSGYMEQMLVAQPQAVWYLGGIKAVSFYSFFSLGLHGYWNL
jgi:hypothetical protein